MPATFNGGVFGSSRSSSVVSSGDGLTQSQVAALIAASGDFKGAYDAETTYARANSVALDYGFAISRVDGNIGNDPLTDDGTNWIRALNGSQSVKWWGRNQTEELPTETIGANQVVSSEGVIGFTGAAGGDESENGAVPGIVFSDISAVTNADPEVSLANSGITFPPARYNILAEFYGNQTPDQDLHIRMMKVMEDSDDIQRLVGTQRQANFIATGINDVHAHYEMFRPIRITAETTFYFRLVNYGEMKDRIVGYVQIERVA